MNRFLLPLVCTLFIIACAQPESHQETTVVSQDPFAKITDQEAREVLQKAMEAMGGLDRWKSKQELSFNKDFKLFREDGSVENDVLQYHNYTYGTNPSVSIEWSKDDSEHAIHRKEGKVSKTINGTEDSEANLQSITNTVLSSVFVVEIPYKLLDPGAVISYAGIDTLDKGQIVDVVQVVYDPEAHSNHSTPDIWKLYFDAESSIMLGYMVQHADHFSYVRNLSDTVVDGFTFVKTRDSWRVNEERELLFLRATYAYDGYQIKL